MRLVLLISLFLFLSSNYSFTQDTLTCDGCRLQVLPLKERRNITISGMYSSTGIYGGLAWNKVFHKGVQVNMIMATNIRHLGLGKFSPLVSVGAGYNVFKKRPYLALAPGVKGQLITSRLTETLSVNNVELLFGYEFIYGQRLRLVQGTYYGFGHESSGGINIKYPSFLFHIGMSYAF